MARVVKEVGKPVLILESDVDDPCSSATIVPVKGTYNVIKRFQPPSCFPSPVLNASKAKSSIFIKAGARTSTTCSLLSAVGGKGKLEALGNG